MHVEVLRWCWWRNRWGLVVVWGKGEEGGIGKGTGGQGGGIGGTSGGNDCDVEKYT